MSLGVSPSTTVLSALCWLIDVQTHAHVSSEAPFPSNLANVNEMHVGLLITFYVTFNGSFFQR